MKTKHLSTWLVCGLLSLIATGLIVGVQHLVVLESLELHFFDWFLLHRPDQSIDRRIVILSETESDLRRFGHPLPDQIFANALEKLETAGARVIGVDKYRDMPVAPGSAALNQVLTRYQNIIWIFFVGRTPEEQVSPPAVLKNSQRIGFNNVTEDQDGVTRRGLLFMDQGGVTHYAFPLLVALHYLDREHISAQADSEGYLSFNGVSLRPVDKDFGGYVRADARGYQVIMDYPGLIAGQAFSAFSLSELLDDKIPVSELRDKIVLLGSKAQSLLDYRFFPGQLRYFGVEQHGYLVSQLLNTALDGQKPMQSLTTFWECLWLWLWSIPGAVTGWRCRGQWWLLLMAALETLAIFAVCDALFIYGWWLPVVTSWCSWFCGLGLSVAFFSVQERTMRLQLMRLFESHVSPQVAATLWQTREQLFSEGGVRPDSLTATVLFTDLSGFTSIAETMEPLALMQWLNQYMEAMSRIIIDYDGMINKYMGDAIMAVFGAPVKRNSNAEIAADAKRAVDCALAFNQCLKELNQQWLAQGLPTLTMRTGIYTGHLVAGSLGDARRMEYTVIGHTVNTAARLESFDKTVAAPDMENPCRILIGASTYGYVNSECETELIGECALKGQRQALDVYRVLGKLTPDQD